MHPCTTMVEYFNGLTTSSDIFGNASILFLIGFVHVLYISDDREGHLPLNLHKVRSLVWSQCMVNPTGSTIDLVSVVYAILARFVQNGNFNKEPNPELVARRFNHLALRHNL